MEDCRGEEEGEEKELKETEKRVRLSVVIKKKKEGQDTVQRVGRSRLKDAHSEAGLFDKM